MIAEVTGHPERTVHGVELERPDARHETRFIDVVARPWHSTYRPGHDATGIAVHSSRAPAVDAAVRELVERSLNGRFWYEPRGLALSASPLSVARAGAVSVRSWTRAVRIGHVEHVYALCVIDHGEEQILVCGTAVRAGQDAAVVHAQGEAIMIYESVARGLETNYHAASSQARFSSLRGGAYCGRVAHLERCLARGEGSGAVDLDRVVVWNLVEGDGVHLVRATANPGTSGLIWWRERRPSHVPIDPFV